MPIIKGWCFSILIALLAGLPFSVLSQTCAPAPSGLVSSAIYGVDQSKKSSRLVTSFNFGPESSARQPVRKLVVLSVWPGEWVDGSNPNSPHEATLLTLSIEKAGARLPWTPVWGFKEAVDRSVAWHHQRHALKHSDMLGCASGDMRAAARRKQAAWTQ